MNEENGKMQLKQMQTTINRMKDTRGKLQKALDKLENRQKEI